MPNSTTRTTNPDGSVTTSTWNAMGALLGQTTTPAPQQQEVAQAPPSTATQSMSASPTVNYNTGTTYGSSTQLGGSGISQSTYEAQQLQNSQAANTASQTKLQASLQAQAEARRLANIQGLLSGGGAANVVQGGGISPNEQAARDAAFARMKDTQGSIALQQVQALQNASAGRGLQGSTIEQGHLGDIIAERGGAMQDSVGAQAIADVNRAADVADQQYQGAITQRGQDLDAQRAIYALITAGAY